MKTASAAKIAAQFDDYLEASQNQPVLITRNGKPVAVLVAVQNKAEAEQLAACRHPAFANVKRIAHVFETSYAAVERELPALIRRVRPDVVLLFGVATRTNYLRIELRARNARSALCHDSD